MPKLASKEQVIGASAEYCSEPRELDGSHSTGHRDDPDGGTSDGRGRDNTQKHENNTRSGVIRIALLERAEPQAPDEADTSNCSQIAIECQSDLVKDAPMATPAVERDASWFRALYEKQSSKIKRRARHCGVPPADCDDVRQEVGLVVFSKREMIDPDKDEKYVHGVCRRVVSKKIRRDWLCRCEPVDTDGISDESNHYSSPTSCLEWAEALSGLSWIHQATFRLKTEGYTAPEIAAILWKGEATVKTHLSRAREHLGAKVDATATGSLDDMAGPPLEEYVHRVRDRILGEKNLTRALNDLPRFQQVVFKRIVCEGISAAKMADELGYQEYTVRQLLIVALQTLHEKAYTRPSSSGNRSKSAGGLILVSALSWIRRVAAAVPSSFLGSTPVALSVASALFGAALAVGGNWVADAYLPGGAARPAARVLPVRRQASIAAAGLKNVEENEEPVASPSPMSRAAALSSSGSNFADPAGLSVVLIAKDSVTFPFPAKRQSDQHGSTHTPASRVPVTGEPPANAPSASPSEAQPPTTLSTGETSPSPVSDIEEVALTRIRAAQELNKRGKSREAEEMLQGLVAGCGASPDTLEIAESTRSLARGQLAAQAHAARQPHAR